MYAVHGSWSPARRRSCALLLVLVLCHVAIFYALTHTDRKTYVPGSIGGGRSLFGTVISEVWQPPRQGLQARGVPQAEAPLVTPPSHWRFPPIDLWPSRPGFSAVLSGFTPVTEAQPDPPEAPPSPGQQRGPSVSGRQPHLTMIRWLRPVYQAEWATAGIAGSLLLDLRIDPQGRPVGIVVVQPSGSARLDETVLQAAPSWRFAWPPSKYPPDALWAGIEVRFHGPQ